MAHVHDEEIQLYIRGQLEIAHTSTIEFHLTNCVRCQDQLKLTAKFFAQLAEFSTLQMAYGGLEARTEPRFRAECTGTLQALKPMSPEHLSVRIINVSKNGLGLLVPRCLYPGTLVQVRIGGAFALGEVRYSRQVGEQFQTGIHLEAVSKCLVDVS
jgi:hypothetical protein